ncbi:MAG TPA: HTTM domain-containing protein, partial [Polyangia bacterium]|nr:HTTM domain-containing protein [Polyangia bacterium]
AHRAPSASRATLVLADAAARAGRLFRAWRDEVGDVQRLGLVRLALGFFLFRQALHDVEHEAVWGYFGTRFHVPILPDALVPSPLGWAALEAAMLAMGALVVVGIAARPALLWSGVAGIYLLLCDRMRYHHHIYTLYLMALLMAFIPCERSWARGRRFAPDDERLGPLWAMRLLQLQLTLIYVASGGSKLLDAEWRSGAVLADRMVRYGNTAIARGVPHAIVDFLRSPLGGHLMAKGAIVTELGLAVALWHPRTRRVAAWAGIVFHVTIDVTTGVDIFSWLSILILYLFATYETPSGSPSAAPIPPTAPSRTPAPARTPR